MLDHWRRLPVDTTALTTAVAADPLATPPTPREHLPAGRPRGAVLVNGAEDAALTAALTRSGRAVYFVEPFRETRDTNSRYFTTYNRTADQVRVQDLLAVAATLGKRYGAVDLVGNGPGGLHALVAFAVAMPSSAGAGPFRRVVADAQRFPTGDEAAYLTRLFIPGILRAGGFSALPDRDVLVHNTGGVFTSPGELREAPLPVAAIVEWLGRAR
jgi:hypothetical protein